MRERREELVAKSDPLTTVRAVFGVPHEFYVIMA